MKKNVMVLALSFLLALLFTSCETEVNTLYHWYTVESGSISESDYNKAVSSEAEKSNTSAWEAAYNTNVRLKANSSDESKSAVKEGDLNSYLINLGLSDSEASATVTSLSSHSTNYIKFISSRGKWVYVEYYNYQAAELIL